jgi:hypothetical protein
MHGSRRGAVENTIRKQRADLMEAPEPCGFRRAGGASDPQREPLVHFRTTPMLNRKSVAVSRPQGLPDLRKKRDRAQFVSFNFLKSTDLHGRVKRSFAPATHASATRCASVAGQTEGARAALAEQGCAVLAALLAKGWRRWGLPSGAERKSNAHS